MSAASPIYGLLAEFPNPDELLHGARVVRDAGYVCIDGYSPFPVHGLSDALGFRRTRIAMAFLIGGLLGGFLGYVLQYWTMAVDYPVNIGGRPLNSWPAYIPVTFECTVLVSSLAGVLGMLALNGLPRPNQPLDEVKRFERASVDSFFLCIEARDPQFHPETTRRFLETLTPLPVVDVPHEP
jgi:hypothetical protein